MKYIYIYVYGGKHRSQIGFEPKDLISRNVPVRKGKVFRLRCETFQPLYKRLLQNKAGMIYGIELH